MDISTILLYRTVIYFIASIAVFIWEKTADPKEYGEKLGGAVFIGIHVPIIGDIIFLLGSVFITLDLFKLALSPAKKRKAEKLQQTKDNEENHAKFYDENHDFLAEAIENGGIEHLDSFLALKSQKRAKAIRKLAEMN